MSELCQTCLFLIRLPVLSILRSPQFKRQQEKTQQAKRLMELENEIDEQHFLIDAKQREIDSLSKNVKVRVRAGDVHELVSSDPSWLGMVI